MRMMTRNCAREESDMIDGYYSEEEVAAFLKKKKDSLAKDRYVGSNHPPYIKIGAMVCYPKDEFERWLRSRVVREYADEQPKSNPFTKREKIRVGHRR
jgi:phage pi2 protein 07